MDFGLGRTWDTREMLDMASTKLRSGTLGKTVQQWIMWLSPTTNAKVTG